MTARWGDITVAELLVAVQGELSVGNPETCLAGLSTDSRNIVPGELFLALRGERYDGHDFIRTALERGAAGVVLQELSGAPIPKGSAAAVIRVPDTLKALGDLAGWWKRAHGIPVAAITGSVGKTTTKEMTAGILERGAPTLKNKGNFNNLIGLPLTLLEMTDTHQRAVLEMGMNRPGEIARLTEIADPVIGLITNVARAHLEGLGDMAGVARAKVELVEKISPQGRVLLNGDDALLMRTASPLKKKFITYGQGRGHDIRADNVRSLGRDGMAFDLLFDGKTVPLRLRVPGIQNVSNALAACGIALCFEESLEHIAEGLEAFTGVKGRFAPFPLEGGVTLIDDTYNANPFSMKAALHALKAMSGGQGRLIVGLGEMLELGKETATAHEEAGATAAELGVHYLVALGEHADDMVRGALARGLPVERAEIAESRQDMAGRIRDLMKEGDWILIKGSRGMAMEEVIEKLKGPSF
ncbi:MAG: UDP-N-acetylmuramoyl-tripeptide--D-alanyl-D-alanine ligase [Desulfatiglandales bacterium]